MSTSFSFETVFRAPSPEVVLAAYFEPEHLAAQDKLAGLADRAVLEDHDDPDRRTATWSVRAQTQLPLYARPFVEGGRLSYRETMVWRKRDNEIALTIQPQILGGRVQIDAVLQLSHAGDGEVRRRFKGDITVNVSLLSGKIERAILAEMEKGMPVMAECTRQWLLANRPVA
jgi:hypothetical protein